MRYGPDVTGDNDFSAYVCVYVGKVERKEQRLNGNVSMAHMDKNTKMTYQIGL